MFDLFTLLDQDSILAESNEKEYFLKVKDMPGIDDIRIEFQDQKLVISGVNEDKKEVFRSYSLSFFSDIDIERVSAVYRKGILSITLPKKERKRIEVKVETT